MLSLSGTNAASAALSFEVTSDGRETCVYGRLDERTWPAFRRFLRAHLPPSGQCTLLNFRHVIVLPGAPLCELADAQAACRSLGAELVVDTPRPHAVPLLAAAGVALRGSPRTPPLQRPAPPHRRVA